MGKLGVGSKAMAYHLVALYLSISSLVTLQGTLQNGLFAQSHRCSKNFIQAISAI
jgi:hypothetical protein